MAVHDPEGLTIASASLDSKTSISRRASARASGRYPVLNAGCPQHVWRSSNSTRSEEHTSELQSRLHLVCRLLLEKKKKKTMTTRTYSNITTTAGSVSCGI